MSLNKRIFSIFLSLIMVISCLFPIAAMAAQTIYYSVSFVDENDKPLGSTYSVAKGSKISADKIPVLPRGVEGYENYVDDGNGKHSFYSWDSDPATTVINRNTIFKRKRTESKHNFNSYRTPKFSFSKENSRGIVAQYTCSDCGYLGEFGIEFGKPTLNGLPYKLVASSVSGNDSTVYQGTANLSDAKTVLQIINKVFPIPEIATITTIIDIGQKIIDVADVVMEMTCTCAKQGHLYSDNPTYEWRDEYMTCSATFSCMRKDCEPHYDGHTKTVPMEVKSHNYTYPDCDNPGVATHIATVPFALENGAAEQIFEAKKVLNWTEKTNHNYESIGKNNDATCTEAGTTSMMCSNCGDIITNPDNESSALGHSPSAVVRENVVEASCTTAGSYVAVTHCIRCNLEMSRETVTEPAIGHIPQEDTVTENETPRSCFTEGSYDQVKYCTVCGDECSRVTVNVEKKGYHTPAPAVKENEVDATCEKGGHYESVIYCSYCNQELERNRVDIPKGTHSTVPKVVEPTCTEEGYTEYTCSICGYSYKDEITDPLEHAYVESKVVQPTCTENGYTVSVCSKCGDENTYDFVSPAGHKWDDGSATVETTCELNGLKTYTCTVCGETRSEEVNKTGHDWPDTPITIQPTCETYGYKIKTCCNDHAHRLVSNKVEPKGHSYATRVEIVSKATCQKDGAKDEIVYCTTCDKILKTERKIIPVERHTYSNKRIVKPTCVEQGYSLYTCADCKFEYAKDFTDLVAHTPVTDAAVAASCIATGLSQGSHCSVCKKVLTAQKVTDKAPHKWNSGEIMLQPTTTETGVKKYTCTVCKAIKKETLPVISVEEATPDKNQADKAKVNGKIKKPANITTVSKLKNKSLYIYFDKVSGAQNYRVMYRKSGAKKWNYAWTDGKTKYELKNLKQGALYEFKFAAYKKNINGEWERGKYSKTDFRYYYKAKIKSVKAAKNSAKVSWKKDKNANGYQILYSTNKDLKGKKILDVKGKNKTSATVKKLKKGKTYYIIVRSYKKKKGKTYIGEYSKLEIVKVK